MPRIESEEVLNLETFGFMSTQELQDSISGKLLPSKELKLPGLATIYAQY